MSNSRARNLKARYGITVQEYEAMLEAQGGKCYICRRSQEEVGTLAVDHSHYHEVVRACLCSACNKALGFLQEDIERCYAVIDYLRAFPSGGYT